MPATTPYWGDLPGPKTATRSSQRCSSGDYSSRAPWRESLDTAAAVAPRSKSNRVSAQTNVTEAQTDSTLSSYALPRESFKGHPLAPRPDSQSMYSSDLMEKRRRRASRNREEEDAYMASGALPAAPDVPKAPPVSFRHPYGNGGLPYTLSQDGDSQQSDIPLSPGVLDPNAYRPLAIDRAKHISTGSNRRSSSDNATSVRNGSATGQRKSSLGNELDHRLFAKTRSPLQTLELTLDSITKEEKRKRLEAAERDARERGMRGADHGGSHTSTVRFKENDEESEPDTPRTQITAEPVSASSGNTPKRVRLEDPQQQAQREVAQPKRKPETRSVVDTTAAHQTPKPQRNLSFRERAGIQMSNGGPDPIAIETPPLTTPTGGISLARTGSNKLKKEPPGDPWYSRRSEAEKKYNKISIGAQRGTPHTDGSAATPAAVDPGAPSGAPMRNKVPPLSIAGTRRQPGRGTTFDDDLGSPVIAGKPTSLTNFSRQKQGSLSTLTPTSPHSPYQTSDRSRNGWGWVIAGAASGAAALADTAAVAGPSQRNGSVTDDEQDSNHDHHFSEIFNRHEYKPGEGLYDPPKYLEEWKKGTVGTLSGTLLDLADEMTPTTLEQSSTWWETPPSQRRNSTSRARKAEAFDGEYDETNGTHETDSVIDLAGEENLSVGHRQLWGAHYDEVLPRSRESLGRHASTGKRKARHQSRLYSIGRPLVPPTEAAESTCLSILCSCFPYYSASRRPRQYSEHTLLTRAARMKIRVPTFIAPTRFKPALCLKCGPLLRYCGMRNERSPSRSGRNGLSVEREFWRGSVMIVTADDESSYDIAPTLRIFAQPLDILPPPPTEVHGEVPHEYVDPIAGHPKLGRRGETRYVRPVHHLEEGKDSSRGTSDGDLFEKTRSPTDFALPKGAIDAPGSFMDRKRHSPRSGEELSKYKDVRGYRLHAERGYTFWRFSIEVELREKEQRIAYRINRGPATGFWVPAKGQSMNIMFHSCNGFSHSVNPDELSGPDPLWRDVLNNHQSRPFHVMLGGGDQLYCDSVMHQTTLFREWLAIRNPLHKHNAPFTVEMQHELESFYLERYCMWFSQGLFGLANSQIPMVNMYDDHDIIDGFGSYPDHFMKTPVFSGLGNVAFKYYMLFQQQSLVDETEEFEPSWALGLKPGPYIHELSRSLFMHLGSKIALLAVDCRTERTRDMVVRDETWDKLVDRCYAEIVKGKTEHLLVLLGVPIAYPRLVWLENVLTSRLLDPIKALGKTGLFGNVFNKFDGGVEVLDDLDDHWTAKNHKAERKVIIEDLQDLAADRSVRITILGGDVHLAAIGQFYSNPKLELAKHKDFRYMPNVISSAIVNTPPPDLMADVLNKRNKVHHLDKDTDEDMIPMFAHGVEGKPRNNKRLLPHRNWCAIHEYIPGNTPPPTPSEFFNDEDAPLDDRTGGMLNNGTPRRLSKRGRGPSYRADVIDSRPPISSKATGGLFRSLSSRGRRSDSDVDSSSRRPSTGKSKRTLSLTRGSLFRGRSKNRKPADDGGINGSWGPGDHVIARSEHTLDDDEAEDRGRGGFLGAIGLRGGGGDDSSHSGEFSDGDELYFTTRVPANAVFSGRNGHERSASKTARLLGEEAPPPTNSRGGLASSTGRELPHPAMPSVHRRGNGSGYGTTSVTAGRQPPFHHQSRPSVTTDDDELSRPKPFTRTPTSASAKLLKRTRTWDVNMQDGLDITLNVEVNASDPAGITVPYRLLVPKLWYDAAEGEEVELPSRKTEGGGSIRRLLSLNRGGGTKRKGRAGNGNARGEEARPVMAGGNGQGREEEIGTAI